MQFDVPFSGCVDGVDGGSSLKNSGLPFSDFVDDSSLKCSLPDLPTDFSQELAFDFIFVFAISLY